VHGVIIQNLNHHCHSHKAVTCWILRKNLRCYGKKGQITEHHFSRGKTILDIYAVIYLTQYFIMSLNGKYCTLVTQLSSHLIVIIRISWCPYITLNSLWLHLLLHNTKETFHDSCKENSMFMYLIWLETYSTCIHNYNFWNKVPKVF
jgi:hypothetical protein